MWLIEKTAVDAICEKYQNYGLSNGTTLGYHSGIVEAIISDLESLTTIEAEPVRHGKWLFGGDGIIQCSECNEDYDCRMYPRNLCPNCGAKMDGKEKEE